MTTVRCPSCAAAVPADASWCTLCFAQLGASVAPAASASAAAVSPAPAPAATPAPAPYVPSHAATALVAAPEPLPAPPGVDPWVAAAIAEAGPTPAEPPVSAPAVPAPVIPAPALPVAAASVEPAAELASAPAPAAVATATIDAPTWPCSTCGHRVSLDLSDCPDCGMPFMGGVSPNVSLRVPGVGDLTSLTPGAKFGVIAGGAVLITIVLVLTFLVLGHIF